MDITSIFLIILFLCGLVVGAYSLSQWIRQYFFSKRHTDARQRITKETLETAIDQRSVFRLEFQNKELQGHKTSGTCIELKGRWLVIDIGGTFASKSWVGEDVLVFFQTAFKRKPSFFQFRARLADVRKTANSSLLRLPMPAYLEPGQKRNSLRIAPQRESVLHMRLWLLDDSVPLPNFTMEIPATPLEYRPGVRETLLLDNISAGGARLICNTDQLPDETPPTKGSRVLFLLLLKAAEEDGRPLALWLTGRITSSGTPEKSPTSPLGIQFSQWAMVEPGQKPIPWLHINAGSGVSPLAAWVMRSHLEQTKRL